MNWKIAGIVVVALFSLIGIGGGIYGCVKIVQSFRAEQGLGACSSGNPDESIPACSAIIQSPATSEPQRLAAYMRRSTAYATKGDYDHAIADDTQLIQLQPREAFLYAQRGRLYVRKNDYDHAIADYTQAIELQPKAAYPWFDRSLVYHMMGKYPQAIDDLSQVLQLEPKNAMAWNNRCYYRAIVGQLDDALSDCNRSLALKPGDSYTLDSRAFTYLKMKKFDQALADYNSAIAATPDKTKLHAEWLYGRGLARQSKHDIAGSKADIAAALVINSKVAEEFKSYGVS